MTIADIRRANLRTLIEQHGGVSRLSEKLGYSSPSFLVQQAGPRGSAMTKHIMLENGQKKTFRI